MGIMWDLELSETMKEKKRERLFLVCACVSGARAPADVGGKKLRNGGETIKGNNCMQSRGGAGTKQ